MRCVVVLLAALLPTALGADEAGDFDYYVLSLSWSPNWCAIEGDDRDSPQCDGSVDFGWTLHGLWPQYEDGWPQDCFSEYAPPSRRLTEDMADIMGTSGLAWHQWNKHGSCSGLAPADYYTLAREAYGSITRPPVFMALDNAIALPASVVQEAFLADNPDLMADQITITCDQGYIQEARICLTRDLEPRRCGDDVIRDCTLVDALFDPVR
jgi:ribonuclease T2